MQVGTRIGKIEVYVDDEKLYEKELYLEENIHKKGVLDYMKQGLRDMFLPSSVI